MNFFETLVMEKNNLTDSYILDFGNTRIKNEFTQQLVARNDPSDPRTEFIVHRVC